MRSVIKSPKYKTLSNENKFNEIERVFKARRANAVRVMTETDNESPELYKIFQNAKKIQGDKKVFQSLEILFPDN